jgi:hypothetical protein
MIEADLTDRLRGSLCQPLGFFDPKASASLDWEMRADFW